MAKMGRPPIEWSEGDKRLFENCCGYLCTKEEICGLMDISDKTLDKLLKQHYNMTFSEVYKKHSAKGRISLRRSQFKLAEKNATMAIFLGKVLLNQKENVDLEQAEDKFRENLNAFFGDDDVDD